MREFNILKLKNCNLREITKKFPPDFKFNYDFAYLVMHFILEQMANKVEENKNQNIYNSYNQLSSKILQPFEREYRNHLRYLTENFPSIGNILHRRNYDKGISYSYKFSPFYQYQEVEVYVVTSAKILKRLRLRKSLSKCILKDYNYLHQYLDNSRLKIQLQEAFDKNLDELKKNGKFKNYIVDANKILKISNGNFYFTCNPLTDGRFHTTFTAFPKKFREFLRYDGEKMVEVDISASVPTFLYFILTSLNTSNSHLDKIINKNKIYYNHYMLVKNSSSVDIKEIQKFGEQISNGRFYQSFISKLIEFSVLENDYYQWQFEEFHFPQSNNYQMPRNKDVDIKYSKTAMLSMLNSKNGTFVVAEQAFKSLYPTIFEFLKEFKSKKHNYFSYLILQTESYFMLNIVARRISRKFKKKIPVLTIHDCIVTTESNIDKVEKFIKSTFENEIGFVPVMKKKQWI